jgi:hypothetical protein
MEELEENVNSLPQGSALDCKAMPLITQSHTSRLRKLWSYGRPVSVSELGGVDLDLMAHGFIETTEARYSAAGVVVVTRLGVAHLNEIRQTLIKAQRPHHDLGSRLATHLRSKGFYTWENVEFSNPDWSQPRSWGVVRPDVFACLPSLKSGSALPAIYEVKVSRADFLADLAKPQKRDAYRALAEAVYYCCKDGMMDKGEIPDGFGLLCEVAEGEFVLRKKARRMKNFVLHADTVMTLMVKRQVPLGDIE